MKKYLLLQLKRYGKVFPAVVCAAVALMVCVGIILTGVARFTQDDGKNTRLRVAISGDTKNEMLQIGISALQTFDDTRFAMELVELPEAEAREQLQKGQVSAVVIFPENFLERALYGDVDKILFITTPGTQNIVSLLKNEITNAVADIVLYCEKGNYALDRVMDIYTPSLSSGRYMGDLSMEYVQMILTRGQVYSLEELGYAAGLDLEQYYVCSMVVFLLMLFGLCFVTVGIKSDHSLGSLLASKGMGGAKQVGCEYIAHSVAFCLLIALVAAVAAVAAGENELLKPELLIRLLPVALMLVAFQIMVFEFSPEPVSGVLFSLLCCLGMCYVSGCFYPIYALPLPLQAISKVLPTGFSRDFLACTYTGESGLLSLAGILGCGGLFFLVTVLTRNVRMGRLWR